jgi:thiamine biosynthesis lipoprotein ApbE
MMEHSMNSRRSSPSGRRAGLRPGLRPPFSLFLLCVALVATILGGADAAGAAATAPGSAVTPVQIESQAFGKKVVVEVVAPDDTDEDGAREAARAAAEHMAQLERRLSEAVDRLDGDAIPADEAVPAGSPATVGANEREVVVDREIADLLSRTLQFCEWSGGAHGPLGGALGEHWRAVGGNPKPPGVPQAAIDSAACNHLAVDPEDEGPRVRVRIAADSVLDLSGFAPGFAVDRAIEALRERGIDNARVRLGRIVRAIGDGPGGSERPGWPTLLPTFEGYDGPLEELTLHDQSVAVVWRADWPTDHPLFVDQRNGQPPDTVWATVAVTELAVDAQALGVSALVLGSREGRFRIAGLKPVPSVLWLQGAGQGRPLIMELNWTALRSP